jgi:hypothetical protein
MVAVTARDQFLAAREEAIWLSQIRKIEAEILARNAEEREILHNSIGWFLADLNRILSEYWVIVVCRLTDPPKTRGHANATIKALDEALKNQGLMTDEIEALSSAVHSYRDKIEGARRKRVVHLDLLARHSTNSPEFTGETSGKEFDCFFESLQRYTDAVGWAVGEGPLDYRAGLPTPGDLADLLKIVLRYSKMREANEH